VSLSRGQPELRWLTTSFEVEHRYEPPAIGGTRAMRISGGHVPKGARGRRDAEAEGASVGHAVDAASCNGGGGGGPMLA
jgi:hypothetical protein